MDFEPQEPKHDKTPNLKLVMNPEGKLHDWTDLPEEDVPEMTQIAMVGNPEIAKTLVTNLNDCKGRGKVSYEAPRPTYKAPTFAGSFRHVFDSRRGIFETARTGNTQSTPLPLARSKTLPDMPPYEEDRASLKRHQPPSPMVPKRTSSKQMVATILTHEAEGRRPLRSF